MEFTIKPVLTQHIYMCSGGLVIVFERLEAPWLSLLRSHCFALKAAVHPISPQGPKTDPTRPGLWCVSFFFE